MVLCDNITQNANGSATIDVATDGRHLDAIVPFTGYATGLDFGASAEVVNGNDPYTMWQITKVYADALAIAGSPDSSTSTKGIGRVSVAPAVPTTPIFVGDNDPRVPSQEENDFLGVLSGVIMPYAGASAPTGFLLCDGSAVSRVTYATLFGVLSTTYGAGDGVNTFNVPDLKGRFPLGYSASAPTKVLTFASRSSNTITITGADNHAHNELQTGQAVLYSAPSGAMTGLTHNTTYYLIRVTATTFQLATSVANANAGTAITLTSDGTGAQTFTITYTARPLAQKGGEEVHALTDAEIPSHNHQIPNVDIGTGSDYASSGDDASCTKGYNPNFITNTAGNDTPHNNMPLFTVVNYIIKT
jgi:microcystin-dependent protein